MDMHVQASCVPSSPPKTTRPYANYHPSIWGDHFLKYANSDCMKSDGGDKGQQFEQLKEEVKKMLVGASDEPTEQLKLIDAIQRLGVAYHFENEIDGALNNQLVMNLHGSFGDKFNDDDDLYTVALRFRLLRQQGRRISCDVFNKFKDSEGKFNEFLINDMRGLLSLYEAAHMRVREEDILDEAVEFTTTHLEQVLKSLNKNSPLATQVVHALNMPIRKGLITLQARSYIPIYQQDHSHNKTLLQFAKLDFNILQKLHQREVGNLTRWWKDLKVSEKLPYARDRLVELYFWIIGVYFEPQYVFARKALTKVIAMTSILDDTYDNYGTLEELTLLTDAIHRWDINVINELPEYMKHIYQALLDVYDEMEEELAKQGRSHHVEYAKSSMKQLVRAYYKEAKWCNEGYFPTMEEYMEVAEVTAGYIMLATNSFVVGMPHIVTEEVLKWVLANPSIVKASSVLCRLTDDMVGHEFEQQRGHVPSSIECYMKQHGSTKEEVCVEFNKRIKGAWKDMNQECLYPTAVPMTLLERVLNLSRVINLLYKDKDGYTHSKTRVKDYITAILVDPMPV